MRRIEIAYDDGLRRCAMGGADFPPSPPARVAVVILTHQHLDDAVRLIDSIAKSTMPDVDVYVVDNHSAGVELSDLVEAFPGAFVVRTEDNLGYAAGNNTALRIAEGLGHEFFWILNPDVVVAPNAMEKLLQAADARPEASIFGAAIVSGDHPDVVWTAGGVAWSEGPGVYAHRHRGSSVDALPREPFAVDYVSGACLFVRAAALPRLGLLPERWFLYFEETDWCRRAAGIGEACLTVPQAVVRHHKRSEADGVVSEDYVYYYLRNAVAFSELTAAGSARATIALLRTDFVEPWARKIERRAPAERDRFVSLAERALKDGLAGVSGPCDVRALTAAIRKDASSAARRQRIQSAAELETLYEAEDPWNYEQNADDRVRRARLLSHLPDRRYRRTLDIGCGNGFVTCDLPGDAVVGCDISARAIGWARRRAAARVDGQRFSFEAASIFDLSRERFGTFDLIVLTGVLYPQYVGRSFSLLSRVIDDLLVDGGVVVSVHIADWIDKKLPYGCSFMTMYKYHDYIHRLEVYHK